MQKLLIADGYNLIFSEYSIFHKKRWKRTNLADKREMLLKILAEYCGYQGFPAIVVFGAKADAPLSEDYEYDRVVKVIFSRSGKSADAVIERLSHELKNEYQIHVATSDKDQQEYILSQGAVRVSARELWKDWLDKEKTIRKHQKELAMGNDFLSNHLSEHVYEILEDLRRGGN